MSSAQNEMTKIEDARFLRESVRNGATFLSAVRALLEHSAAHPEAPPPYLPEAFGRAFAVHPAELVIFGGWFPGGEGEVEDARLQESLVDVVIEYSTDALLVGHAVRLYYRGYECTEAGQRYRMAERRQDAREVIRVAAMDLKGRKLSIRYRRTASFIGDGGVRRIALHAIVRELCEHAYDGEADEIEWKNLDTGARSTEPYVREER